MTEKPTSLDDYRNQDYEQLLVNCLTELEPHLIRYQAHYDPFTIAVAIADHFREQVAVLVEAGDLSPEEAAALVTIRLIPRPG